MENSFARNQSSHDIPREGREDNAHHVAVKNQTTDGSHRETILVTLAVREDQRRHVLTVDMVTVAIQRTLGRLHPITEEDMVVGGAEAELLATVTGATAAIAHPEILETGGEDRKPAGGHVDRKFTLPVPLGP